MTLGATMIVNYIRLGRRIKSIRKKCGLSQLKLSELIDRTPSFISHIEQGQKNMSLDTLVLIANALHVGADELLIDSLEASVINGEYEFSGILTDCTEYEKRVLIDSTEEIKNALRCHRKILDLEK